MRKGNCFTITKKLFINTVLVILVIPALPFLTLGIKLICITEDIDDRGE